MAEESYRHKVPEFAKTFPRPDGKGRPANAVRSWCRKGVIKGFHQHSKNAEYRLSASGVRDAWLLWADHKGLDPEADMPDVVREIVGVIGDTSAPVKVAAQPGTPTVRIEVPPGVAVEVVYKAA